MDAERLTATTSDLKSKGYEVISNLIDITDT
jgi:hypothetical protein